MGSENFPAFLGPSVLEVTRECCFSPFQGIAFSPRLQIVHLSNSPQMIEFVLFAFMEKSLWLDKAEADFRST